MRGGSESEERRRPVQRLRQVRKRCYADPAADEERSLDVEAVAVSEGTEDRNPVAGLEGAKSPRSRPDRVDQEGELAGWRETEAHRPRQEAAGCLEHEELAGSARLEAAAVHTQERVRADLLGAGDLSLLGPHRSALGG